MTMDEGIELAIDPAATAVYAHLFDARSDPTRLSIVQHLTLGEHRVRDLVDHLGMAQSTISAHIAFLKDCGLVSSRPVGRATMYRLTEPEDLASLFTVAQQVLAATGAEVSLCSHLHPAAEQPPVQNPTAQPAPSGHRLHGPDRSSDPDRAGQGHQRNQQAGH